MSRAAIAKCIIRGMDKGCHSTKYHDIACIKVTRAYEHNMSNK